MESVSKILAELADDDACEVVLARLGAIPHLSKMLGLRASRQARINATRALSNLSSNAEVQPHIVETGALGRLMHIAKSGRGIDRVYARAACDNFPFDTAAIRIQTILRGRLSRARAANIKRGKLEAHRAKLQQREARRVAKRKELGLSDDATTP